MVGEQNYFALVTKFDFFSGSLSEEKVNIRPGGFHIKGGTATKMHFWATNQNLNALY